MTARGKKLLDTSNLVGHFFQPSEAKVVRLRMNYWVADQHRLTWKFRNGRATGPREKQEKGERERDFECVTAAR